MAPTTLTFAAAGSWQLDSTHSSVGFHVPYLAGTFRGRFTDVDAELAISDDGATLTPSSPEWTADSWTAPSATAWRQ